MAETEATDVRIVSSGPAFEIWKGPKGSMRLDWTKKGGVRIIVDGHGHGEFAAPEIRRWADALRLAPKVSIFIHFFKMPSYDSQLRSEMQGWAGKHRAEVALVYVLSQSRLVNMGVSVANLAVGGIIKSFTRKEEFDLECQRHGFPMNPVMTVGE